jgi:glycosyltransferase involved in cell wall biosynthesis
MLADDARLRAMGAAGRRRYEERFTADRMVAETLAVYEERDA